MLQMAGVADRQRNHLQSHEQSHQRRHLRIPSRSHLRSHNNGDCVTTCPSGYTGIGSGETWRTCEACGNSCDQCSSSSTCTQCSEFHVPRQQRRLHVNMPKCSCQYRFRGNRTHLRGLKDGCGQCTDSDTCMQCLNSMYLKPDSDYGTRCPSGYTGTGSGITGLIC